MKVEQCVNEKLFSDTEKDKQQKEKVNDMDRDD
jgi:hypothetical protein